MESHIHYPYIVRSIPDSMHYKPVIKWYWQNENLSHTVQVAPIPVPSVRAKPKSPLYSTIPIPNSPPWILLFQSSIKPPHVPNSSPYSTIPFPNSPPWILLFQILHRGSTCVLYFAMEFIHWTSL